MRPIRWTMPAAGAAVLLAAGLATGSNLASAAQNAAYTNSRPPAGPGRVAQPTPPVVAADFPMEPAGRAPTDNDGKIPNPSTPTGSAIKAPTTCTVTFDSKSAGSMTVNAWIKANENTITKATTLCLAGTFDTPVHIWSKSSRALLEIAPAPGQTATLDLGTVNPADTDPNQYWSDTGGVSIVDSRSVEIYGLTVENFTFDGPAHDAAGIYVTTRSDTANTDQGTVPHESACFLDGNSCSDIYIIDNTVKDITNRADEDYHDKSVCGNAEVAAYGIAVVAAGGRTSPALQHLVVEGNTVTGTRTGQSETVTFNG
ncbi:MAG TPA: hypothetical protein VGP46_13985, partial [Acidimicrobiales bacterium]|nr:hypothetical protein [Acidimicrobiales bacterium]